MIKISSPSEWRTLPVRGTMASTGYDLQAELYFAPEYVIKPLETKLISTGFHIAPEAGVCAFIVPRSSVSRQGLLVHTGTIDSDYRGELKICITNLNNTDFAIKQGERLAQLIFAERVDVEFESVPYPEWGVDTERGEGGFGSTGK